MRIHPFATNRLNALLVVVASQVFLVYRFTSAHLRRFRERMQTRFNRQMAQQKRRTEKERAEEKVKRRGETGAGPTGSDSAEEFPDKAEKSVKAEKGDKPLPDIVPESNKGKKKTQ